MRLFLAGVTVRVELNECVLKRRGRRLFTYYHHAPSINGKRGMGAKEFAWWSERVASGACPPRLHFLDSGAYSAWRHGTTIDLDAYAALILAAPPQMFAAIANVDVIPGRWGVVPTQRDIDRSAEQGWEHYRYLCQKLAPAGLTPMHIYHQGEHEKWLRKLMDECDYFGVSPGNDRKTREKIIWLDALMKILTDRDGKPLRKFHGFGVTALSLVKRYPWFSIDSTTWRQMAMYGKVFFPWRARQLTAVTVSDESPHREREQSWHVDRLSAPERQRFDAYLQRRAYALSDLRVSLLHRDMFNTEAFIDFFDDVPDEPFDHGSVSEGFF